MPANIGSDMFAGELHVCLGIFFEERRGYFDNCCFGVEIPKYFKKRRRSTHSREYGDVEGCSGISPHRHVHPMLRSDALVHLRAFAYEASRFNWHSN